MQPNPPTQPAKRKASPVALIITAVLVAGCCIGGITAISSGNSSSDSGTTSSDSGTTSVTPTGPSDDQVRQEALGYKACPGKEGDTLQNMFGYTFTIAHDQVKGSRVIGRSGSRVKVGVQYVENGQDQEATFEYDTTTHQVVNADSLTSKVLDALKAECPAGS